MEVGAYAARREPATVHLVQFAARRAPASEVRRLEEVDAASPVYVDEYCDAPRRVAAIAWVREVEASIMRTLGKSAEEVRRAVKIDASNTDTTLPPRGDERRGWRHHRRRGLPGCLRDWAEGSKFRVAFSHVRVLGWPAKTGRAWLGVCRSSVRTLQSSCGSLHRK
jgi:hypothetical protein